MLYNGKIYSLTTLFIMVILLSGCTGFNTSSITSFINTDNFYIGSRSEGYEEYLPDLFILNNGSPQKYDPKIYYDYWLEDRVDGVINEEFELWINIL